MTLGEEGTKLDNFVNGGMLFGVEFAYQLYDVVSIAAGLNWSQQGTAWQKYDMSGRLQTCCRMRPSVR